jgi:hypothetical protein
VFVQDESASADLVRELAAQALPRRSRYIGGILLHDDEWAAMALPDWKVTHDPMGAPVRGADCTMTWDMYFHQLCAVWQRKLTTVKEGKSTRRMISDEPRSANSSEMREASERLDDI